YYSGHDGYDYGLYYEPVAAAAPGRVTVANWLVPGCHTCLSGQTIEIDHGNGLLTFYGHLSRIDVSKGQYASAGQVIGLSGMTGNRSGQRFAGKPGEADWFWATVTTNLGWWDGGGSDVVRVPHLNHGAATT